MWKTALLLIVTIIIVPFPAFRIDTPLNPEQQAILADLLLIHVIAAALCFITSTITDNYSQVAGSSCIPFLLYRISPGNRGLFRVFRIRNGKHYISFSSNYHHPEITGLSEFV